jgi:hypothetical protein
MELMRLSTDLLQLISQFSHNHGEELKRHIQGMVSRTHHSNGSHLPSKSNKRETLETKVSLRKFMDLLQPTSQSCHNHGEESLNHIKLMVSRTQLGNGLIKHPLLKKNLRRVTSEIRRSSRESTVSSTLTTACIQLHTQERNMQTTVY